MSKFKKHSEKLEAIDNLIDGFEYRKKAIEEAFKLTNWIFYDGFEKKVALSDHKKRIQRIEDIIIRLENYYINTAKSV